MPKLRDHGLSLRSAMRALRTIPGTDHRAMLAGFEGPVLILNGERDEGNREEEEDAAAVAKDATIVMVEDAGHACSLTQPAAFSAAIDDFCRTDSHSAG
ncbi:MAG: alpha/beta hydrolase [Acidimicrobiia bacterium]|nr:alpha/beta hydrolase [Acidimicrobiia bacterium]